MAPRPTPGQQAWLNHIFEGQQDFRRKPSAPAKPSPAKRGAQTRARNAARAAAAATPDYTPEMQGSGDTREKIRRVSPGPSSPTRMNRANVITGGRASATAATAPRPPVPVSIPGIPEGGYNVTRSVGTGSSTKPITKVGTGVVGKILKATKIGVPVIGTLSFLADSDRAEGSESSNQAIARRSGRGSLDYIKHVKAGADASGVAKDVPIDIYNRAVNYQRRANRGQVPGVSPARPRPSAPSPAPKASVSRLADYGAAPPKGAGKFLRSAYLHNKTRANMVSAGAIPDRAQSFGTSSDILPTGATDREKATKKFKETHAWARNPRRSADLNQAITYLANKKHRGYFAP